MIAVPSRLCNYPGCPHLAPHREHARPARQQRGHGAEFDRLRPLVLERDGYTCRIEIAGCTSVATTVDYVVPWSKGGPTTMANLRAACLHCNSSKGAS